MYWSSQNRGLKQPNTNIICLRSLNLEAYAMGMPLCLYALLPAYMSGRTWSFNYLDQLKVIKISQLSFEAQSIQCTMYNVQNTKCVPTTCSPSSVQSKIDTVTKVNEPQTVYNILNMFQQFWSVWCKASRHGVHGACNYQTRKSHPQIYYRLNYFQII